MSSFVALHWKSVLTHVGVGMGAASFWRGAWYIWDDHLFPNDRAASALSSWSLGVVGIAVRTAVAVASQERGAVAAEVLVRVMAWGRYRALVSVAQRVHAAAPARWCAV